jgi:hypothetical protein
MGASYNRALQLRPARNFAGCGLFATQPLGPGAVLGEYGGRVRYCDEVERQAGLAGRLGEYSIELHACGTELGEESRTAPCLCTPDTGSVGPYPQRWPLG